MQNINHLILVLVLSSISTGCATIDRIEVGDVRESEPIPVTIRVGFGDGLVNVDDEAILAVGSYGIPEGTYTDVGTAVAYESFMVSLSYTGEIGGLDWGAHSLRATVGYNAALQSYKTTEKTHDFWVGAPSGCFDFDDGSLQEWTVSPLIVGNETVTLSTCALDGPPILWDGDISWPISGFSPEHGSLHLVLGPDCVPTDSSLIGGETSWRINMQSPNLDTNPHWQGTTGVSYRVRRHTHEDLPHLWVQALIKVRKPDGTETWLMGGPDGAFETVESGELQVINQPITGILPDWTVLGVIIQVYGEPGTWAPDDRFSLDGVCPMAE